MTYIRNLNIKSQITGDYLWRKYNNLKTYDLDRVVSLNNSLERLASISIHAFSNRVPVLVVALSRKASSQREFSLSNALFLVAKLFSSK